MQKLVFTKFLMAWNRDENKRQMPWKGEKNPYKVWLSEVILQQTRVDQGWAYYEKFVQKYPSVAHLARADDNEVFKMWEGLGYYTRCKNLLYSARFIDTHYHGKFPSSYPQIKALKGIGPYTAAAIASFCFGLPHAVVDGNVFRVLSRVFGIETPVDNTTGKKQFTDLAASVLDKNNPGIYNQAIMDFGATVCKPMLPLCAGCALNKICVAFKTGLVNKLPIKEKILKKKMRWFSYFIFHVENKILVRKRNSKDIWENLFEFYLTETEANPNWSKGSITDFLKTQFCIDQFNNIELIAARPQQLTHQLIKGYFIAVFLGKIPVILKAGQNEWLTATEIKELPFPAFINQFLENKNIQLVFF